MELKRTLTWKSSVFLVIGNMIGAGIFTTSGVIAKSTPHPLVFLGLWLAGGLLTLFGAMVYAELGARFPRAGGDYQFLKEAFGPWAGFLLGWISFWIITPGSIAALSIAFVSYLPLNISSPWVVKFAAIGFVLVISQLNYRGTRPASSVQNIVTITSVALLIVLSIGPLITGTGSYDNFSPTQTPGLAASAAGMTGVIFAYSGWFASAYVGSEIINPRRSIPLSLVLGTTVVAGLYLAVNTAYLYVLPTSQLSGVINVGQLVADRMFGPPVSSIITVAILLAITSSTNATVMTGARICYAMATDRVFFKSLGAVHARHGTPHVALIWQTIVASLLVLLGNFAELLSYVVTAMLLSSVLTAVGLFVIRARAKNETAPFAVWGYPLTPILFIAAYLYVAVSIVITDPYPSLIGAGMIATGVPFYLYWYSQNHQPK